MSVIEKFFVEEQFSKEDPSADPNDICGNSEGHQKRASLEVKDDKTFTAEEYVTAYHARNRSQTRIQFSGSWEDGATARKFTIADCQKSVFPRNDPDAGKEHIGKTFEIPNGASETSAVLIEGLPALKKQ